MSRLTTTTFSLAILLFLHRAIAQGTGTPLAIGCVAQDYVARDASFAGAFGTAELCADACYNNAAGFMHYAIWSYLPDDENRCQCSNVAPASTDFVTGSDSQGSCSLDTQSSFYVTSSTFSNEGCAETTTAEGAVMVVSPEACLSSCRLFTYAFFSPTSSNQFWCACGDQSNVGAVPTFCGQGSWLALSHTAEAYVAGPTGFVRRQNRERKRREEREKRENRWCPAGLKACKVPGDELAFECLNVADELESCGGCMHGDFGSEKIPFGVDCSALPGVAPGGVTCSKGLCRAYACDEGYNLALNSTCLSSLS
nr:uncharacterized protein CI109_004221 [Kwoniella shandongensis]KAA5527405.1 hypothetical protein CI109_004221 [Kwoniella shandongensis]